MEPEDIESKQEMEVKEEDFEEVNQDIDDQNDDQRFVELSLESYSKVSCSMIAWEEECDIYLMLEDKWETLNEINETIHNIFAGSPEKRPEIINVVKPDIGTACLAIFDDDGILYRAEIVAVPELPANLLTVVFVDFGNRRNIPVNNPERPIYRLPSELLKFPKLAVPVRIKDQDKFTKMEIDKIRYEWIPGNDAGEQPPFTADIIGGYL